MTRIPVLVAAVTVLAASLVASDAQAVPINLDLVTGAGNKLDLGFFAAGTTLQLTFSGNGDLVDSRYQTNADGSLFAPATGVYSFANPGANYPATAGGDGINHYVGGGAAYDFSGSGYGFAGLQSTDTTNAATIRNGAIVGTFSANPSRTDWFFVGNNATVVAPSGGARLYLAVNDTNSTDNHGTYTGNLTTVVVPESSTLLLALPVLGIVAGQLKRRKR